MVVSFCSIYLSVGYNEVWVLAHNDNTKQRRDCCYVLSSRTEGDGSPMYSQVTMDFVENFLFCGCKCGTYQNRYVL